MKPKTYEILARAVEEGIEQGYRRAHKHTATPSDDHVKSEVFNAVMGEVAEVFEFDEGREEE